MTAMIKLANNTVVSIDNGVWAASDSRLQDSLTIIGQGREKQAYEPDSDALDAEYIVQQLGGEIIYTSPLPVLPEGAVW